MRSETSLRSRLALIIGLVLLGTALSGSVAAATVTVDVNTTYQKISGFGGFGGMHPWWTDGPFYDQNWLNLLFDTLGLSIIRTEFQPRPEQADMFTKQVPYLQALQQRATQSGVPLKVIASVWTPPASFKSNNNDIGGSLNMAQVGPFSDYLVGYLNLFKQQAGFDLYALSPQNEPVGPTSYNSCGYTAADYTALLLTLCPKMRAAGLSTRVYFADDIFGNFGGITAPTAGAIRSDTVTSNVASILSDHYSGGSDASSRPEYRSMGGAAKTMGKEAWNTEFGNGSDDWNGGAWANVRDMYSMLSLGYSGIVYWLLGPHTNASQADESVMYSLTPGPKARAIQAFARTIRPGAVRVRSVSTDSNNVRALAFRHDAQSKICVVLINNSSSQQTVSLAGSGLPASFSVNLTSPTSNYASMASAGPGNNINLPVKGILCLVGTAALSAERPSAPLLAAGVASVKAVRTYSLDGKLIRNTPSSRNAGAYCTVVRDDAGRATIHAQAGSWGGDR